MVVNMFSTILVAVPAFNRVDPAMTSGPTSGAMITSTNVWSSLPGQQVTKMIFHPRPAGPGQRPPDELGQAAGGYPDEHVLARQAQPPHGPAPLFEVVLHPFPGLEERLASPRHDRLHEVRRRAERRGHLRRLEHAETPARAGPDEDEPSALAESLGDQIGGRSRCVPSRAAPPGGCGDPLSASDRRYLRRTPDLSRWNGG